MALLHDIPARAASVAWKRAGHPDLDPTADLPAEYVLAQEAATIALQYVGIDPEGPQE